MRHFAFWVCVLSGLAVFQAVPSKAGETQAPLTEERIMLPAQFKGADGSPVTLNLDALVIRPDDGQKHPLVVINHGTPTSGPRWKVEVEDMRRQTEAFASRGWVAVTYTRRGYGRSEGEYSEGAGECDNSNYVLGGQRSRTDIREVIRLMSEKPYVDSTKIISVGQSAGGFATVALTADPPPGLVAAINFAGGRGSRGNYTTVCSEDALISAMATFGQTARVPTLWVYSENDTLFPPPLAQRMFAAYTGSGGNAEFIQAPSYKKNGHLFFKEASPSDWGPYVDDFLRKHGLTAPVGP
jgi:dienelactone hydrolase